MEDGGKTSAKREEEGERSVAKVATGRKGREMSVNKCFVISVCKKKERKKSAS